MDDIFAFLIKIRLINIENYPFLHACAIMPNRRTALNKQIQFVGFNSTREVYPGCNYGEHAEMAAIKKLRQSTKISKGHSNSCSNRKVKIDFWINRTTKRGLLKYSKPCQNCIKHMSNLEKIGYKIVHVYYPDREGNISKIKFTQLVNDKDQHQSCRFRNT